MGMTAYLVHRVAVRKDKALLEVYKKHEELLENQNAQLARAMDAMNDR